MKRRAIQPQNSEGFALLEAIVFMIAFIILTYYAIDFFTIVHTGIVNSIGARTYLFETLQHRTDIALLRQDSTGHNYATKDHFRVHLVSDEKLPANIAELLIPGRRLTGSKNVVPDNPHNVTSDQLDSSRNITSVVWIKAGYGICVDYQCPAVDEREAQQ